MWNSWAIIYLSSNYGTSAVTIKTANIFSTLPALASMPVVLHEHSAHFACAVFPMMLLISSSVAPLAIAAIPFMAEQTFYIHIFVFFLMSIC